MDSQKSLPPHPSLWKRGLGDGLPNTRQRACMCESDSEELALALYCTSIVMRVPQELHKVQRYSEGVVQHASVPGRFYNLGRQQTSLYGPNFVSRNVSHLRNSFLVQIMFRMPCWPFILIDTMGTALFCSSRPTFKNTAQSHRPVKSYLPQCPIYYVCRTKHFSYTSSYSYDYSYVHIVMILLGHMAVQHPQVQLRLYTF